MRKKRTIMFLSIFSFILVLGYMFTFPKWLFPSLYPTFVETIESNWDLTLPAPESEIDLSNTRGGPFGDGDAVTELHYSKSTDLEKIKALSNDWISGEDFKIENISESVRSLLNKIDPDASYYYKKDGDDTLIIKLKGNIVTIYESYY